MQTFKDFYEILEISPNANPDTIERAIVVIGIPRADFTPEALSEFVRRYEARTGTPARLSAEGAA